MTVDGTAPPDLVALRGAVLDLLAETRVPPSRIQVRSGDLEMVVEWPAGEPAAAAPPPVAAPAPASAPAPVPEPPAAAPAAPAPNDAGLRYISAGLVGTFYRAANPGATPFVEPGDRVTPGQQVAIIEAMKLMTPVEADAAGTVVEVMVSDGASVEYGAPLIALAVES
nr:acetyl-CoA carboxylase biotin carboxylase subunit [Actinoallomurus sp.]